jgi:hypothetical protein
MHRRMHKERLVHRLGASELGDALHPSILKTYGDIICDMIVMRRSLFPDEPRLSCAVHNTEARFCAPPL